MKLLRLLSNLGYGSRREVQQWIRSGAVTSLEGQLLDENSALPHDQILFRGEPLDPPFPLTILLHKPDGYTCSADDPGAVVYDLLPGRFADRKPGLNPVGRLDKDTTGLLLLTDDGKLLHKIIHPKSGCRKIYQVSLDRPMRGNEAEIFASGTLMLHGESKPLLPAELTPQGEREALIAIQEGRYHQVRRMFAATGNHVTALRRIAIGGLALPGDLAEGGWRIATAPEIAAIFQKPENHGLGL